MEKGLFIYVCGAAGCGGLCPYIKSPQKINLFFCGGALGGLCLRYMIRTYVQNKKIKPEYLPASLGVFPTKTQLILNKYTVKLGIDLTLIFHRAFFFR